jgi:hypothetical protein
MVLDVVATRDISPDEEVFIDYGAEWEMAWDTHVDNYGTPCQSEPARKTSKAISSMNEDKFNKDHLSWSDDHFTVCKERFIIDKDTFLIVADKEEALRDPFSIGGFTLPVLETFTSITRNHIGFNLTKMHGPNGRVPCLMVGAMNETEATIDVVYFLPDADLPPNAGRLFRVFRLPSADLEIIPMPFRSDMFYKKSFRQPIKIPDDIFPGHWKDKSLDTIQS